MGDDTMYGRDPLDFAALRRADVERLGHFKNNNGDPAHSNVDGSDWTLLEWAGAMGGECGEAQNVAKKFRRGDYTLDNPEHVRALANEIADTVIYADLLAYRAGIDLGEAVREKFNAKSRQVGSEVKL